MNGSMTFSARRTADAVPPTGPRREQPQRGATPTERRPSVWAARMRTAAKRTVGVVVGIAIVPALVALALLPLFGMRTMIVLSGSMSPTFDTGDAVVVAETPPDEVAIGDVITYAGYGTDRLTTHRVIDIREVDGQLHYRTQGDANPDPDPNLAPAAGLQGEVRLAVPHLGWMLSPLMTRTGKLLILGLPATLLVGMQLRTLSRSAMTGDGTSRSWRMIAAAVALAVVAAGGGVVIARTLATFTDAEQAGGNTFQTGAFGST